MTARELEVPATDGYPLAATLFDPRAGASAAVVVNPATAVKQGYYSRFAAFLAEEGFLALTYDYRGIGGSRPARLRGFGARMRDWAERDAAGVLAWLGRERPDLPVLLVGHSFGGQALGLLPSTAGLSGVLMVGAQSGYWGHWAGLHKAAILGLWHVGIPTLCLLFGYFPSRLLGMGEDLPAGVAREWARWGRRRDYLAGDGDGRWRAGFQAVRAPIRSYSFSDDRFAPLAAVEGLLAFFRHAPVERRHLRPADLGVSRVGHWGFFRDGFRETLWRESAEWLRSRTAG